MDIAFGLREGFFSSLKMVAFDQLGPDPPSLHTSWLLDKKILFFILYLLFFE